METTDPRADVHVPTDDAAIKTPVMPGSLRSEVTLTLETRQAQRLVSGRARRADRPAIIGLIGFAGLVQAIWQAAKADDPYADWWLIQIDEALTAVETVLLIAQRDVDAQLQAIPALRVIAGASTQPVQTALQFSNPVSYRAAGLVARYDRLVCGLLTAQHTGCVGAPETHRCLAAAGRQMRRALLSPVGYRSLGITRESVRQQTPDAQVAQARMGVLPEVVLSGAARASQAPHRPIDASNRSPDPARAPDDTARR